MLPQIIYLALAFMALGISLAKHGESRSNHNFGLTLLSMAIAIYILWWGGFFKPLFG